MRVGVAGASDIQAQAAMAAANAWVSGGARKGRTLLRDPLRASGLLGSDTRRVEEVGALAQPDIRMAQDAGYRLRCRTAALSPI